MQVFLATPYQNGVCAENGISSNIIRAKSELIRTYYLTLEYAYPITVYVKTAFGLILARGELPLS